MKRRSFLKGIMLLGLAAKSSYLTGSIFVKEYLKKVIVINVLGESTEGGEIRLFMENNLLVKVEKTLFFESGRVDQTFLLSRGQLFEVEECVETYNVPFYITEELANEIGSAEFFDQKKSKIVINNYYFNQNSIGHYKNNSIEEKSEDELGSLEHLFTSELADIRAKLNSHIQSA